MLNYNNSVGNCTHAPTGGSYSWTLPIIDSTNCKIRVSGTDSEATPFTITNSVAFTIDSTPPPAPTGLTADGQNSYGRSEWKNTPDFSINWTNPTDDSGIKGAWYGPRWPPIFADTGTKPFTVTAVSQYSFNVYMYLEDNAGNANSSSYAQLNLRWDATPPTNPNTCSAWRSSDKFNSIANNTWQIMSYTPYFEWSGAGDGLPADCVSGVAGYTVYWGTSIDGDPGTGAIQTNTSYTINTPASSESTYYLRVRTKDNAGTGNWSEPCNIVHLQV